MPKGRFRYDGHEIAAFLGFGAWLIACGWLPWQPCIGIGLCATGLMLFVVALFDR